MNYVLDFVDVCKILMQVLVINTRYTRNKLELNYFVGISKVQELPTIYISIFC